MPNNRLRDFINSKINKATVILCFKILLENVIENGYDAKMTKSQIETKFNLEANDYCVSRFRTDYILRQAGNLSGAVDHDNTTYSIKPEYLTGMSFEELQATVDAIDSIWAEKLAVQRELLREVDLYLQMEDDQRKFQFIEDMLLNRETGRKGQCFEVTSFSILRQFFIVRGFELNRFSITYSNDGGIDFTAQNAIYQVTNKLDNKKFNEDIIKAPLKERIFVYRTKASSFDIDNFNHELVLDNVGGTELLTTLEYLFSKKPTKNMNDILKTMLEEFKRENSHAD